MTNEEFQKIVLDKLSSFESKFSNIEERLTNFESKFSNVEGQLSTFESKFSSMEDQIAGIKDQLDEHTQILKALVHASEVNAAERDKMSNDIAHIKGEITGLRKDMLQVEMVTSSNWNEIARLKAMYNDERESNSN